MEFEAYSVGLCFASVCTSLTPEAAAEKLNHQHPTGIDSQWELSDEDFSGGQINGCDCPDHKGNKHYLYVC